MRSTSTLSVKRCGEGPPVVLVHGAAPPFAWGDLPRMLAGDHEVVAYARRGFPPAHNHELARSLRDHTEDLGDVVGAVGRATVIGWSSGGVIALDFASRHPEMVRGAVVIEPPLHAKRHPTLSQLIAVAAATLRGHWNAESGARRFLDWALGRRDGRSSDLERLDPHAVTAAAPAIVNEITHATGEREITRKALRDLQPPIVWLVGTSSAAGAPRIAERASRQSPAITVKRVEGAGHAIAIDAPEAVVEAVETVETSSGGSSVEGC